MDVGSHQIISVSGLKFKMVLTEEYDGYNYTHRSYDLFYGKKVIGKDIGSIKMCYYKALVFAESKGL